MKDQATSPGCPEQETISALFDGEYVPDDTMRAHIASCPDCARRLADFATMRELVMRTVESEPPPGFEARIASFVRAESAGYTPAVPKKRDFSDSRTAWIFRIAALFILSGFFVYLLTDQMRASHTRVRTQLAETTRESAHSSRRPTARHIPHPGPFPFWKQTAASGIS